MLIKYINPIKEVLPRQSVPEMNLKSYKVTLQSHYKVNVVNSMKLTPIKYLMYGVSNNQATKTKCMEVIITNKK